MRSDPPENVCEGKMAWSRDRDARETKGKGDAGEGEQRGEHADMGESPALKEEDAEGRANRERTEGGDAVPGDNFGDVLGAGASDAPDGGACADHAFANA